MPPPSLAPQVDAEARRQAWLVALEHNGLPPFVTARLTGAATGQGPWIATMTPAELLLMKSHGIRPVATVSGTCWYAYGRSWTEGHAQGWHEALERIGLEAAAAGANAVVDVRMRTLRHRIGASMDFTLIGTAVNVAGLQPTPHPVVATVPALELIRLLEADIVPVGIAVGARYEWLGNNWGSDGRWAGGFGWADRAALNRTQRAASVFSGNQPLTDLMDFWNAIRRAAHADLRAAAARQGNGVLAHTQFGQLIRQERDKQPPAYLGRHIVIGTVVDAKPNAPVPHTIDQVVDMRDALSPLRGGGGGVRHSVYQGDTMDEEGAI